MHNYAYQYIFWIVWNVLFGCLKCLDLRFDDDFLYFPLGQSTAKHGNLWESLGYDVFSWFPQASKICRITFSTWDFGGQSVFHNLHHLFLSRYSVYLVVFKMPHMMKDPQRAVEMIRYWLNSLALHAKGAPILLVGTHKDQVSWPMGTER